MNGENDGPGIDPIWITGSVSKRGILPMGLIGFTTHLNTKVTEQLLGWVQGGSIAGTGHGGSFVVVSPTHLLLCGCP